MFAVLKTGGKQYRIEPGAVLSIEQLPGEIGSEIELKEILLVENEGKVTVGSPLVSGARVKAQIVDHIKGDKLIIFKKIRRHGKRLKKGHRQGLTRIKVTEILS